MPLKKKKLILQEINTIMKKVPLLHWKENLARISMEDQRVDTDLIYIDSYEIPKIVTEPFRIDTTTTMIYESGSVEISIDMKRYKVESPCMVVMLADSILQLHSYSEDLKIKALVFSKRFSDDMFHNIHKQTHLYISTHSRPVIKLDDIGKNVLKNYLETMRMIIANKKNPYRLEAAKHYTLSLFFSYAYNMHSEDENIESRGIVQDFISLLKDNYRKHRDLTFYSDKLSITPKYLTTLVKGSTSKSAHKWIEDYVIIESKALLRSSNKTIEQISLELSFNNQDVFSKFFKRVTGISPSEYRRRF